MSSASSSAGFQSRLRSRSEVAEGTMAFRFEKPAGWMFKPGQFIELGLPNPPETDAEGNSRAFSIASAPHEPFVMIATRMRDTAFKRVCRSMPIGSEVRIEGPFGNLVLHNNASRPAVILAGGIGITPFRSMLLHAAREKLPHRIFLFFSNHRPEDTPFLDELEALQRENPNYKLIATMTDMEKSARPWRGETSLIDKRMLDKYLHDASNAVYYSAGPPGMVNAMHAMLNQAGIDDDDIRTEEFAGY